MVPDDPVCLAGFPANARRARGRRAYMRDRQTTLLRHASPARPSQSLVCVDLLSVIIRHSM